MRIVIDTNLLVSALVSPGLPRRLPDAARAGRPVSRTLVNELRSLAVVSAPRQVPRVVPTDPDDDRVWAAALAGAADLIASGDKRDLLPMGS